ncbi:hypothetical protein V2J09_012074 [Rumex salicifolius]
MADDSSVKMETLKKAYAEIILNTSKEAAAKIMVADRRARCFEKDLNALKEDALRMLVQLKQMLDFKAAEAEVKSENQQRKIDELEAQLSEAEGIIVDLREELRLTQDKLEEVKYSQWRSVKQQNSEDFEDQQPDDRLTAKTDDGRYVTNKYPSTENTCGTKNLVNMALPTKPLQPSILSRAVHYPSGDLLRSIVEKPSTSFRPSMLSQPYTKTSREHCSSSSSEPDELDAKLVSNGSEAKSQEFESHHGQSFRDGSRRNRKNLKYQEAIAALRRSSHGKNAKSCQLPSLTRCRTKVVKQNRSSIELSDKNGMYNTDHNHDTAQANSIEVGDISKSREMEGNTAEKESDMSCCDPIRLDTSLQDVNMHDIQISDDEETAGISSKADSDKVLKFTFQRKRKRELLTNLDSSKTPEEKNEALLQKEDAAKLQKSVVKDEQTKDGRQLLQIAQQLISLSGNGHS